MITLSRDLVEVVLVLSEVMDIEEDKKLYHAWRVAYLSRLLAKEIMPEKNVDLFLAGLLHDIGTFDLPNHIVHYSKVTFQVQERPILAHPIVGADIVATFPGLIELGRPILHHHERYDGFGYPFNLKGDEIPFESQILRLADSLAFLSHTRVEISPELINQYISTESDKEFSKKLEKPAIDILSRKEVCLALNDTHRLAAELSGVIEEYVAEPKLEDVYSIEGILNFFGRMLDAKHRYTVSHSARTSRFSVLLAMAMGLPASQIEIIRRAGLLHDIGKLGIPLTILTKPGRLTEDEFEVIKSHASAGARIVEKVSALRELIPIVEADQEHFDGSGYPKGLKSKEIPLESRIILIADAFDAMTSTRSYRKAMSIEQALTELQKCSGTQFDPDIVKLGMPLFKALPVSVSISVGE